MKKEIKEIEKNLKATLSGFKDAKEMYGYDLANETYYVKEALKQVKLLDLHIVIKSLPTEDFFLKHKHMNKSLIHFEIREKLAHKELSKRELVYVLEILNNLGNVL